MLTETRTHIADLSPVEFEKWCTEILRGYAVERNLQDFVIKHNQKVVASDGNYQIDIYAEFTALEAKFKVLCECKKLKLPTLGVGSFSNLILNSICYT